MNKQPEFDQLWTYAKQVIEYQSGPNAGYFPSFCDDAERNESRASASIRTASSSS